MTIPDPLLCLTPTNAIASHHKFYPTRIPNQHHQLRHQISVQENHLIYYVSNYDILVLDLHDCQNSLLATVPFEPTCLAADLGWLAVGGENNGDCAFIKVEKDEHGHPKCFGHDLVVESLGGAIVNSMNIHTIPATGSSSDVEPVVLISNNDKTVKIYSLLQRQVITTFLHPVPMNYSAMSPDSTIIAAVGDSNKVYFYRHKNHNVSRSPVTTFFRDDWVSFAEPSLPTGDSVYDDYCFALAFSPSGHLCAASSQGGAISVFDVLQLLNNGHSQQDAMLCNFRSSRPTLVGCVRAMAFSPAPWDLLAWAEDHGRIGLVDVRSQFVRRQVLELDRRKPEAVELEDGTPFAYRNLGVKERLRQQHLARLRAMRRLTPQDIEVDLTVDELIDPNPNAQRHQRQELLSYHQGLDLDARERSVVDALETTIHNIEHNSPRAYSIHYPSDSTREYNLIVNATARPTAPGHPQPRRRTSIVLSPSTANSYRYLTTASDQRIRFSASPARIGDDDNDNDIPAMSTNNLTPSVNASNSHPQPHDITPSNTRQFLESAMERARETANRSRAQLSRIEAALDDERHLASQLERLLAEERQLSSLLRRQLETQQRLLMEDSNELIRLRIEATDSNTYDRVLRQEINNEQQSLQQRSQELEEELRIGTDYARRLETERARVLTGTASGSRDDNSSSAQTSALPTTNIRPTEASDDMFNILSDYTDSRTQRIRRIEQLQMQYRRAESRVALASSDMDALEEVIRRTSGRANVSNITGTTETNVDAQISRASANLGESNRQDPSRSGISLSRAAATRRRPSLTASDVRASRMSRSSRPEGRPTEIGSSRPQQSDLLAARIVYTQSASAASRALDTNGNWLPGSSLHRILAGASALSSASMNPNPNLTSDGSGSVDVFREMGLGTAGLGFSPDGHFL